MAAYDAASREPALFVVRRFEARFTTNGSGVREAELISSGMSGKPHTRVLLSKRGGAFVYSLDGERFGKLSGRPGLLDLERLERRLDEVSVRDATIEEVPRNGMTAVVLDADIDVTSFRSLLDLFAGETPPARDELDLRAYSVSLTADDDVALDYWWSLVGTESGDDATVPYRRTVACHVQINVGPPQRSATLVAGPGTASLPALRHIDEVWALARASEPVG